MSQKNERTPPLFPRLDPEDEEVGEVVETEISTDGTGPVATGGITMSGDGTSIAPTRTSPKSVKWISSPDIGRVIEIISKTDKITPEEAVRRLNKLCVQGSLVIVPQFGAGKKS